MKLDEFEQAQAQATSQVYIESDLYFETNLFFKLHHIPKFRMKIL